MGGKPVDEHFRTTSLFLRVIPMSSSPPQGRCRGFSSQPTLEHLASHRLWELCCLFHYVYPRKNKGVRSSQAWGCCAEWQDVHGLSLKSSGKQHLHGGPRPVLSTSCLQGQGKEKETSQEGKMDQSRDFREFRRLSESGTRSSTYLFCMWMLANDWLVSYLLFLLSSSFGTQLRTEYKFHLMTLDKTTRQTQWSMWFQATTKIIII